MKTNYLPPFIAKQLFKLKISIFFAFIFCLFLNTFSVFGQVSVAATSGTVGPTTYSTLKLAFDAVNNGIHKGVVSISITGNTTETVSASLNASGTGSSSYTSLLISPSGGAFTISGAIAAGSPLINLNGADNVTINGLNTGVNSLTISNTTVSATAGTSTIRFIGDASNNTVTNCKISGSETGAVSGTIFFSTGTATGNDGNTISNNTITAVGSNLPTNALYSAGTSVAIDNSGNTISANNIQDYFNSAISSIGINIASNSSAWTINSNKFFQTATRTVTANALTNRAIYINTASAGGYTISNNTIGFANASGTGTTVYDGNFTTIYRAIELTANTTASNIQGNIVSGINFTTSAGNTGTPGIFSGIIVNSGAVNVGTTSGNIIGSTTGTTALVVTSTSTNSSRIDGIYVNSPGTASSIQNNTVGSISTGGGITIGYSIIGIETNGALGNFTVSGNIIGSASTSNSISSGTSGVTTTGVCSFYGIYNTATGNQTITNNSILNTSVYGTGASFYYGIYNNGGIGAAIAINDNTLYGSTLTGTGTFRPLYNGIAASSLTINTNILRNFTISNALSTFTGIQNVGAVTGSIAINNNQLGNATSGLLTYSVAGTSGFNGILNSAGTAAATLTMQSNDIRGIVHSLAATNAHTYLSNSAATLSQNISSNTFTNLSVNTTGSVTFISNNVALPASGTQTVSTNAITGTFNKTGAGGTVTVFTTGATSTSGTTITNSNNNFSNITVTGATTLTGWNQQDLGATTKTVSNNTFSNWAAGTNAVTSMLVNGFGGTSTVTGNTISTVTGQGAITGLNIGTTGTASTLSVSTNTITGLSSTGTGGNVIGLLDANNSTVVNLNGSTINTLSTTGVSSVIYGLQVSGGTGTVNVYSNAINGLAGTGTTAPTASGLFLSGGTTANIYKNKIYDIAENGASTGVVNGINITSGTTVSVYNNLVGDLKAPLISNTSAVRGILVNSTVLNSTYKLYYNSVNLNASSTGTNFGTQGIYHTTNATATTASLIMNNNVVVNTSTANGTGKIAAYYRNNTTLTNYSSTSNNNLFYAGTPSANNLIFYDGTNSSQTLSAFQSRVTPREINSTTENFSFLSTTGSSSNYLKPNSSVSSYIESTGINISGITADYEGTVRQGNPGYLGTGSAPDLGAYEMEGIVPSSTVFVSGAIGVNGDYGSLSSAFLAINNGATQTGSNIVITINKDTNEGTTSASLSAGSWTSLSIRPNGVRTITGNTTAGSPLINLNGADNVTIDGYNANGNSLTISNTTVSATAGTSTIQFINDAATNVITNCTILGSSNMAIGTNGGVVYFATGTTTGNDTNTISNCNIGPAGTNLPSKLIFGNGTTGTSTIANSGITVTNCNLYDYFLTSGSAAVYASTGNTDWNITNNKIYQSSTRTFTATGAMYGIYFVNATFGNNVQITGNTIGYANNAGTGTLTLSGSTFAGSFYGIYFQVLATAGTACNLNGNTISDISLNSSTGVIYGINNLTTGSSNTININNNFVKNISLLTSTGVVDAINWGAATAINVTGNTISGISRDTAGNLYGITSTINTSATETITSNSIYNLSANSAGISSVYGIYQSTTGGTKTYQNNSIYNLSGTGGTNLYGVYINTGTADISSNLVYGLTSTGGTTPTLFGIRKSSTAATNIYKNKVYDISSNATTPTVYGIYSEGAASATNIYNNIVGDLKATLANSANPINGIYINTGTSANVYYNTVFLNASSSGALFGSSAVYANTAVTVTFLNNIFVNNSSVSGAGLATAYRRSSTTLTSYNTTSNNNLFYGSTIFTDGTNTDTTLANYKTRVSTRDNLSISQNPNFVSTVGSNALFLHIESSIANLLDNGGATISGYTTDFDGDTRNVSTPDIGADEFLTTPIVTNYTPSAMCSTGGTSVTITGNNFNTVTSVKFNGVSGTITSQSTTSLVVTTPVGITAGTISLTNTYGTSTTAAYTISPVSVGGSVASNQTICSGATPADVTLSGHTGIITKWQMSTSTSFTSATDIASTSATLSGTLIGALSVTTYVRAVVQSGSCSTANSAYVTITVNPTSVGGTSASNQTICTGTQPTSLVLTGNTGSVVKWQSAADVDFTLPIDIASTSTTLLGSTIGSLTAATYFRAVVQSGVCSSSFSSFTFIDIDSVSIGGTAASDQTVCSGLTPSDLTLTGNVGNVIKWQIATDVGFTSPTDIASTSTTLTGVTIGALSTTSYIRAVVQNGSCSVAYSDYVTLTVVASSVGGVVTDNQIICSGSQPADLVLTGNTGMDVMWQKSTNTSFSSPTDLLVTTTSLTGTDIGNLTTTTYFRAVVQNGSCLPSNSNYITITVNETSVGGNVSSDQAICTGSTPSDIAVSANTGSIVKWQSASDSAFTSPVDIASTATTLSGATIGVLTSTTYFRAVVQNGVCSSTTSDYATIVVASNSVGGAVSSNQFICSGTAPADLIVTGQLGAVVKWQSSTDAAFTSPSDIASTSTTLTGLIIGNLSATTYFRAVIQLGSCTSVYSLYATVTVNSVSVGGTLSSDQAVCIGTSPSDLVLTGNTGSVVKWQSASDMAFTSPVDINSTSNTLTGVTIGNLYSTIYFRALVQNGSCSVANSNVVTVIVNTNSVGGTVASDQTIGYATLPSDLTLSGNSGSILNWQSASNASFTTGVTTISSTSNVLTGTTIGSLTTSTYYRAVVQSGSCSSANSDYILITVDPASVGGAVSTNQSICTSTTPASLTLSGYTGTIVYWQSATNTSFTSPSTISNTTATLSGAAIGALSATTYFRAVVQNGLSPVDYSSYVSIDVSPTTVGGTVSSNQTICINSQPSDLILSGNIGSVLKWQKSSNASFSSPIDITSSTSTTLTGENIGNLSTTTYFRAVVQSGNCSVEYSNYVTITITSASVGGAAFSDQTICSGDIIADIVLSGNTGNVLKWQRATNALFSSPVDISSTSTTLTDFEIGSLTTTSYFRAVVQNGGCASANSAYALITVNAITVGGTVNSNQSICSGTQPSDLNLSGQTGTVIKWQKSTNVGFTSAVDIASTSNTLLGSIIGNLSATTYFRAVVQSANCLVENSSYATVTVNNPTVGGSVASDQSICTGSQPSDLSLSGETGTVIKWQKASDTSFTSPTDIASTSSSLTSANMGSLTATTYYRAVVQNGSCSASNSSYVTITVTSAPVGGTVSSDQTVCYGNQPANLTLTGSSGNVVKWQSASDSSFTTPVDIASTSTTLTGATIGTLASSTYFRVELQNGSCSNVYSTYVYISVDTAPVGGSVSADQTICTGSQPLDINLTGSVGNVVKWQKATNTSFTSPTDIASTSTTLTGSTIGNLSATTYFRAVVQNGVCSDVYSSNYVTITVNAASVGGTVAANQTVCSGAQPSDLAVSGHNGTVVKWQKSNDTAFTTPSDIASTSSTLTSANIGSISTTTYFRAVVQNGTCSSDNSSYITISIYADAVGGSVSSDQTICTLTPATDLVLTGQTGNVVKWQKATNSSFTSPTDIASTSTTLSSSLIGSISTTTYFRAVVQVGNCSTVNSNYATITILSTTWDGTAWNNGAPNSLTSAIIAGNYTSTGTITACNLTINNSAVVTVNSGHNFNVYGTVYVAVGASLTFENNSNLLQTENTNTNSGNIIVKRNTNALIRLDYNLWSTPVSQQQLQSFSSLTLANRFYFYNSYSNFYNVVPSAATDNFALAKGYLIRLPNDHPTTPTIWTSQFTGVPNNGDITVATVQNGGTDGSLNSLGNPNVSTGYNAIGNPYPSTIDANTFITTNSLSEALYFWRKTNNSSNSSYATYTMAGGTANSGGASSIEPNGTIQVGQGFIIKASSSTVSFTNAMRIANNDDQFLRTSQMEKHRIWLNLSNETASVNQMMVAYMTGATNSIDPSIDGRYINDSPIALNSYLNNEEFIIQGRNLPFEASDVVPLTFKTTIAGNYTIAIDHVDGLFLGNQDVFLKDNLTGAIHDLKLSSYNYASEIGTFNNRFELVYTSSPLGTQTPIFDSNSIIIYKQNGVLNINSGRSLMKTIKVFDIRGRLLLEEKEINLTTTSLKNLKAEQQVLIVQITDYNGIVVSKKVVY